MFLTYALRKTFFRLSLKKPKWFRFQNLRGKKSSQLQTNITSVCFVKASRKAGAHLFKWLLRKAACFQSGFRRKYSCNTVLARFTNSWLTAMNKSEVSGVAFLDQRRLSTWLITIFYWRSSPFILKTQVLYHFLNHIFIIESNASYPIAHTPPKNQ